MFGLVCALLPFTGCIDRNDDAESEEIRSTSQRLAGDGLVISQVYLVRNAVSVYNQQFVELFNRSSEPVGLLGLSLQTAGSTSAFGTSTLRRIALPDVSIPPGGYFLIGISNKSGGGEDISADLNATSMAALSPSTDKIAIVRGTAAPSCGTSANRCSSTVIVDMVGYQVDGSTQTVSDFEGTPTWAPEPGATVSLQRKGAGCTDTNDNRADFELGPAAPRRGTSPAHPCSDGDGGSDSGTSDAGATDAGDDGDAGDSGAEVRDGLVISQVYGGATSSSAVYSRNFIELFNGAVAPRSLRGLSVQFQYRSGSFDETGTLRLAVLPDVTLPPGGYYLIACDRGTNGASLPAPDLEAPATMPIGTISGKVALARTTAPLSCGTSDQRCSAAEVVDLVGYGGASDYEGTGHAAGSFQSASVRRGDGCTDTDDNASDFVASAPIPRSSASPIKFCDATYGNGLVVSQVYATGGHQPVAGNQGSMFKRNFIELFNRSNAPIPLLGLSLQYVAGSEFSSSSVTALPDVRVPPGGHFLVGYRVVLLGATDDGANFVADLESPISMVPDAEKVAIARGTTALGCGGITCSSREIVDLVGIGSATLEGPAAPGYGLMTAATRKGGGCTDTDNNAADFEEAIATPRSSFVYPHPCDPDAGVDGWLDAGADAGPEAGTGLVISQVYAGGGSGTGPYYRDYVEIFNRSPQPISLAGLSLQYGRGQDDFGSDSHEDIMVFPDVVVGGEQYFLVGLHSDDFSIGKRILADTVTTMRLDPDEGRIALARTRAPLGCGGASGRCPPALVVDMIGYGAANDFEGAAPAPPPGNASAALRKGQGCTDTDDNASDFTTGAPEPRNSKLLAVDCALPTFGKDAGAGDASTPPPPADAGADGARTPNDAGSATSDAGTSGDPVDDSGCSCRAAGTRDPRRSGIAASVITALGLAISVRRRRRVPRSRSNTSRDGALFEEWFR